MSIVSVIVDSREPKHIQELTFGGAMVSCDLLTSGDLLVIADDSTLLAIERKTPDDLLNSIRDNRIWSQLTGIRQLTKWSYLVITGDMNQDSSGHVCVGSRVTGWTWAALQGALLQVQEMGVFVMTVAEDDYEAAVIRLSARSHRDEVLFEPARAPRVLSEAEQIVCSMPGIGPEKAQSILEYANTPAWALSWLTMLGSPERVPGIGDGIKRSIRKALGLQEDEELSVVSKNGQPKESKL